jgi:tetratricopeptide (TPR) repeat protein
VESALAPVSHSGASGIAVPRLYWAFLSYRHADNRVQDREWASWLQSEIEAYTVPADLIGHRNERGATIPERITPIFRDEEELAAASDMQAHLHGALENSRVLIVLCSPGAVASKYVSEEIEYFKGLGRSDCIVPVLLAGEPGDAQRECFPAAFHDLKPPLAADFRLPNGAEGYISPEAYQRHLTNVVGMSRKDIRRAVEDYTRSWQLAKLKVIAAVLGVRLDDLRQRDRLFRLEIEKRKSRVLRRWLTLVAVLAVLACAAGLYANTRRVEAEHARADAEAMIEFLQDDAKATLSRLGRLDMLEGLNRQVFRYLDKNSGRVTGLRHHVEAKAAYDQAMLFRRVGNVKDMEPMLERAGISSQAAAQVDRRDEWLDVAAIAALRKAELRLDQQNEEQAKQSLTEAETLAARVLRVDPRNAYALTAKYGSTIARARMDARAGRVKEALAALVSLDEWFQHQMSRTDDPGQHDHVLVLLEISKIALAVDRPLDALQAAERAIKVCQRIEGEESADSALAATHLQLGDVYRASTDFSKAIEHFEAALTIAQRRLAVDDRSDEWNEFGVDAASAIAKLRAEGGDNVGADAAFAEATKYARQRQRMDALSSHAASGLVHALQAYADFLSHTQFPSALASGEHSKQLQSEAAETVRFAKDSGVELQNETGSQ